MRDAKLETPKDRENERRAAARMQSMMNPGVELVEMPEDCTYDYNLRMYGDLFGIIDAKLRKESIDQVKEYPEGLELKARVLKRLQQYAERTGRKAYVAWAFDNGEGAIVYVDVSTIGPKQEYSPKPRRKERPHAKHADSEPVVYLNWSEVTFLTERPEWAYVPEKAAS